MVASTLWNNASARFCYLIEEVAVVVGGKLDTKRYSLLLAILSFSSLNVLRLSQSGYSCTANTSDCFVSALLTVTIRGLTRCHPLRLALLRSACCSLTLQYAGQHRSALLSIPSPLASLLALKSKRASGSCNNLHLARTRVGRQVSLE